MRGGIEVAFCGRLGRDAELRQVKGGTLPMIALNVAVDTGRGRDDDATQWVRVVLFGPDAAELAPRLLKGAHAYVEGALKLERWTAPDGTERSGLSVVAWTVLPTHQIGRRRPRQTGKEPRRAPRSAGADPAMQAPPPFNDDISDVGMAG